MEHTSGSRRCDNESTNLNGNAEERLGTKMGEDDDPWDRRGKGGWRKERDQSRTDMQEEPGEGEIRICSWKERQE